MNEILVKLYVTCQVMVGAISRKFESEEGTVAETVVIVAVFVALAIAIGAIITNKVTTAANNINMN